MRLLIVTTGLEVGGAERAIYNLVLGGIEKMGDVHLVSLRGEGYYGKLFKSRGISVTCLNLQNPINLFPSLIRITLFIKKFKPNIIQGWMYHGNLFSLFASRLIYPKAKVYWGIRQSLYNIKREKFITRIIIRLCSLFSSYADCIIYNSVKSKGQHESFGFNSENGIFIPNGFNIKVWKRSKSISKALRIKYGIKKNNFVIGYVGRFHPMKNIPMMLKALNEILKANKNVLFLIAGENTGRDNQILNDHYNQLPSKQVISLGVRHDIPAIMSCLDLLCLTSSWGEGFSNTIGEAMSSGVPCISTDVGDSSSIIGKTGWVIKPNDIKALKAAINSAIRESSELYQSRSLASIARVSDNYQLKKIIKKYIKIYTEGGN